MLCVWRVRCCIGDATGRDDRIVALRAQNNKIECVNANATNGRLRRVFFVQNTQFLLRVGIGRNYLMQHQRSIAQHNIFLRCSNDREMHLISVNKAKWWWAPRFTSEIPKNRGNVCFRANRKRLHGNFYDFQLLNWADFTVACGSKIYGPVT